jgi:hypothetical protein
MINGLQPSNMTVHPVPPDKLSKNSAFQQPACTGSAGQLRAAMRNFHALRRAGPKRCASPEK